MADEEVGGRDDVVAVQRAVMRQARLPVHQDRVGGLVELEAAGVRRGLAVRQRVARHRAVRLLLALEQERRGVLGGPDVPGDEQAGERLVEVAREHLAIGAEVRRLAVGEHARRDRLAPRRIQSGGDGAGERLSSEALTTLTEA